MRAQRPGRGLLVLSTLLLMAACQPAQAPSAPMIPFDVNSVPASAPTPDRATSGVRLTASLFLRCAGVAESKAQCQQPYAGEFVITALNGAEVTRVVTNQTGQATVDLPPGKYLLGVRTEDIYPLATPVKVDVLADRYVHISLSLDAGPRRQSP